MASVLFSNNASAALASSITSSATTITVTTGAGAQFPAISGGNYFYATLTDSSNNLEIVKVTGRATDVLTVVRAQEGTTARAYAAADKIELRITNAALTEYVSLAISAAFDSAKQALYPVGSLYSNAANSANPATLLGFGTWVAFGTGKVVVGYDSTNTLFDAAEKTGGSYDATLPTHTHTATSTSTFTGTAGTTGTMSANATHSHTYSNPVVGGGYLGGTSSFSIGGTGSTSTANIDHTHSFTPAGSVSTSTTNANAGTSATNANLPPFITVYMWKRTA